MIKKAFSKFQTKKFLIGTRGGGDKSTAACQHQNDLEDKQKIPSPRIIRLIIIFNETVIYTLLSRSLNWRNGPCGLREFIWEISSPNQLKRVTGKFRWKPIILIFRKKKISKTILTMRKNFITPSLSYLASFAACRHPAQITTTIRRMNYIETIQQNTKIYASNFNGYVIW